jgi:hypothetical protein
MMKRLHATLSGAQNPSLLEMRILTNHSNDPKFEFLKKGGKWRDIWERIRRGENVESSSETEKKPNGGSGAGLAGLGDYGSSDSENEEEEEEEPKENPDKGGSEAFAGAEDGNTAQTEVEAAEANELEKVTEEERRKQEAKAEKVREWARKRKEAREGESVATTNP